MIFQFLTPSGDKYYIDLPIESTIGIIVSEVFEPTEEVEKQLIDYHKKYPIQYIEDATMYMWKGLWITNKGKFIHVVGPKEAYILTEDGKRIAATQINSEGHTELVGSLLHRRIGEEKTTKEGIKWPSLQL